MAKCAICRNEAPMVLDLKNGYAVTKCVTCGQQAILPKEKGDENARRNAP